MVEALARLEAGALTLGPQSSEGVTYARKIDKSETRVDWTRPAEKCTIIFAALSPFPGAWCEVEIGGKAGAAEDCCARRRRRRRANPGRIAR